MELLKKTNGPSLSPLKLVDAERRDRWPALDLLRGAAVVMMIVFHFVYDLRNFLPHKTIDLSWLPGWFWFYMPRLTGGTFLFVLGCSCWLKRNRHLPGQDPSFMGLAPAALKLGAIALAITLATALFMPSSNTIFFGILHCLAVTKVLLFPFLRFRFLNLAIAFALIALGPVMENLSADTRLLMPFGVPSTSGTGGDWYALIPWAAAAFLGAFVAALLANNQHTRQWPQFPQTRARRVLIWLGQRSLPIYLLHQPLMIGAIKAAHFLLQGR